MPMTRLESLEVAWERNKERFADSIEARIEALEDLIDMDASFEEAYRRAGFPSKKAFQRWALRHDVYHLYSKLLHRSHVCTNACMTSPYHNRRPQ